MIQENTFWTNKAAGSRKKLETEEELEGKAARKEIISLSFITSFARNKEEM